jgi:hypothetical protein
MRGQPPRSGTWVLSHAPPTPPVGSMIRCPAATHTPSPLCGPGPTDLDCVESSQRSGCPGVVDLTSDIERAWDCEHLVVAAPEAKRRSQRRWCRGGPEQVGGVAGLNLVSGAAEVCRQVALAKRRYPTAGGEVPGSLAMLNAALPMSVPLAFAAPASAATLLPCATAKLKLPPPGPNPLGGVPAIATTLGPPA